MLKKPPSRRAAALMATLALVGCRAMEPQAGSSAPQTQAMPVHAALVFSGPFRWVERDQAFELAGAGGPVGLDQPLRPLATLHWPACPARPAHRPTGPGAVADRLAKPVALCQATVRFGIAADGRVNRTQLIHAAQSEGVDPLFNFGFSVVTNVNQWRFEPPLRAGKPTDVCCVELRID